MTSLDQRSDTGGTPRHETAGQARRRDTFRVAEGTKPEASPTSGEPSYDSRVVSQADARHLRVNIEIVVVHSQTGEELVKRQAIVVQGVLQWFLADLLEHTDPDAGEPERKPTD